MIENQEEWPSKCVEKPRSNAALEKETTSVSKLREALPQCLAVGAKNLLLLTFGSSLGFPTILIPELQKENQPILVSLDELTWIGSINLFLVPLGGLISGPVSQRLGRRKTMMMSTIPFIVAWITFHYATNVNMLFVAQALTGITGGLLEAPVLTYVAEVTQPHLRGMLSATSTMAVICGVFTQMLSGSLVHWRTVALINLIYPLVCFMALYLVPESPMWLAGKGRVTEAEKALCWLRGWVTPEQVRQEFHDLCKIFERPINTISISSMALETHFAPKQQLAKRFWSLFMKRSFYLPFALVTWAFFINAFGGIMVLQVFAVVILEELRTPIDKYQAAVIVGMAQVIGTTMCVFIIHFTGKRKLVFVSVSFTGLSLLLISVYSYLVTTRSIYEVMYTWIPTSLMVSTAFFSHICLKTLPWILAGEVFPSDVRSIATGLVGSIGYIFSSIANKLFFYMKNSLTLSGSFFFYASMNFIGVVGLYFMLPETEGRTLKEIEEHFAGNQKLNSKPKRELTSNKEKWAFSNSQFIKDDLESRL